MSHGSRRHHLTDHHLEILKRFLSDPHVIAELKKPRHIDYDHDVPDTAGYSVDGRTLYVDRHLADAKPKIDDIPFDNWVTALVGPRGHEPIEKVGMDIWDYTYPASHEILAIPSEHLVVRSLGGNPEIYEKQLRKYVKRDELERIAKPPIDLDCRPYFTDPDRQDLKILAQLRKLGVVDAMAKHEFHPMKLGAKQAPDGKWYLPDRKRPGKYLRVMHGSEAAAGRGESVS